MSQSKDFLTEILQRSGVLHQCSLLDPPHVKERAWSHGRKKAFSIVRANTDQLIYLLKLSNVSIIHVSVELRKPYLFFVEVESVIGGD